MIYLFIILLIILLIPLCFFSFMIVFEYRPKNIEESIMINPFNKLLPKEFSVTTFNIGYCSLDKSNDFFFEGGLNTRGISKEKVIENLEGNSKIIEDLKSDIYLLQEVDESGSRSHHVNQLEYITSRFDNFNNSFAFNYRLKYLFYPFLKPMGSAYSGLLTLSKFMIKESSRYALEGQETFPRSLFFIKRCMTVNIIKTIDEKELFMINIHLSAYDKNGDIRKQQAEFILNYLNDIYDVSKNYIIIGGDWNHLLPKEDYNDNMPLWVSLLPDELYDSDFRLVYDKTVNTVRSANKPYIKGINFESVIDGFLVSPNVETIKVESIDFGFKYSDHNPVRAKFRLK